MHSRRAGKRADHRRDLHAARGADQDRVRKGRAAEGARDKGINDVVRLIGRAGDGSFIVEHTDGRLERATDETDWARVDEADDAAIEQAMRDDPDWAGHADIDWSSVQWSRRETKTPISIRVDDEVLAFFKAGGPGYQRRINDVLRSFVSQKQRRK